MTIYDPGQQQDWQPPAPSYPAGTTETQPAASGDRWAIAALAIVASTLIGCVPGLNCLSPLVPLIVGIVTLTKAKNAVNPSRARLYGWLAVGLGALFLLVLVGAIAVYGTLIARMINDPSFRDQLR